MPYLFQVVVNVLTRQTQLAGGFGHVVTCSREGAPQQLLSSGGRTGLLGAFANAGGDVQPKLASWFAARFSLAQSRCAGLGEHGVQEDGFAQKIKRAPAHRLARGSRIVLPGQHQNFQVRGYAQPFVEHGQPFAHGAGLGAAGPGRAAPAPGH